MKDDLKNKIIAEVEAANFFSDLPTEIDGFKFQKIFSDSGDKFNYFSYENSAKHKSVTAYFHEETFEYKMRVKIGLNEFCLTKFFTSDFKIFQSLLREELESVIKNLNDTNEKNSLIGAKNFGEWKYGQSLKKNIEGFELFISPAHPTKYTNGSYIILNYSNFDIPADLVLYYNIYTDDFSGEFSLKGVPHVSYLFDAKNLDELAERLEKNLVAELQRLKNSGN